MILEFVSWTQGEFRHFIVTLRVNSCVAVEYTNIHYNWGVIHRSSSYSISGHVLCMLSQVPLEKKYWLICVISAFCFLFLIFGTVYFKNMFLFLNKNVYNYWICMVAGGAIGFFEKPQRSCWMSVDSMTYPLLVKTKTVWDGGNTSAIRYLRRKIVTMQK